jgi:hypothetical protein
MTQDIIDALREVAAKFEDKLGDANLLAVAADEIESLRRERDEARREVLLWVKERCSWVELSQEIKQRGWEYLKEDGK